MEKENIGTLQAQAAPAGLINLFAAATPFAANRLQYVMPEGETLQEMLDRVCPHTNLPTETRLYINGDLVYPQFWRNVRPKSGSTVTLRVVPQRGGGGGGKNPLRTILTIAVFAAGAYFGPALGTALFGSQGIAIGGLTLSASTLGSAIIGGVGKLLVSAIAPVGAQKMSSLSPSTGVQERESPTLFIQGARNALTPFGVIPVVLGRHRMIPPQAAKPYTETAGDKQFVRQLFCWGYGRIELSELKIGETDIADFTGIELTHVTDGNSASQIDLFPNSVDTDELSILIQQSQGWQTRTTGDEVDEIMVDLTWAQGLVQFNGQGQRVTMDAMFAIRYSPAGENNWTEIQETLSLAQASAVRRSYRYQVPRGKYDVSVQRVRVDIDDPVVFDKMYWTALRTVTFGRPVLMEGLGLTAMRAQATDQFNGSVDQFNGVVSQIIPDWDADTQEWVERATSNPASIFRFVLQGLANARPIDDSMIDIAALEDWHEFCEGKGLTYNSVIDYDGGSVLSICNDIAAAGRASPSQVDGKWSVIIDRPQTTFVQHVTPRNSWGYQYERDFPDPPHAFLIDFINQERGWLRDERPVYADGYDKNNATDYERMSAPGVTDPAMIHLIGREGLAELVLRPDTHSFMMDIEHLTATRGDLIHFAHDVILVGLGDGRVKSVEDDGHPDDPLALSVVLDEPVDMQTDKSYSVRFRRKHGQDIIKRVVSVAGETDTLEFMTPFPLEEAPEADDVFMFGETGLESLALIIREIETRANDVAMLKCKNAAPEIFEASSGPIPDFESGITIPTQFLRPLMPVINSIQTSEEVQVRNLDGSISNRMVINMTNRNGYTVHPVVKVRQHGNTDYVDATVIFASAEMVIVEGLQTSFIYDVRVFYRRESTSGQSSNLISLPADRNDVLFVGTSSPPSDVENFDITVRGETAYLTWDRSTDIDIDHYEIRFSVDTANPTWASSIPINQEVPGNATSYTVPSTLGSFLIKAFDHGGRYSANAAIVITTIGAISGLNFIETIVEHESWGGTHDGTRESGGYLKLGGVDTMDSWSSIDGIEMWDLGEAGMAAEGTYQFETPFDLGDVFTCVLSARLVVTGENLLDRMDTWTSIDTRESWDGIADPSHYSATLLVSTTNDDPNDDPEWGAWSVLTIGEYTFRGVRFSLELKSMETNISPVVMEAEVTIDMPDRIESSEEDITVPIGGINVVYPAAFRVPPALGFAIDNLQPGDIPDVYNKTEEGFFIRFLDADNNGVERTFSYVARGYGYKFT